MGVLTALAILAGLVVVHEAGHFFAATWQGIRVSSFSIGFGPVLFNRTDRRGTRWQIAAIPLGGYVKFKGDSDAASGKDAAAIAGLSANEKRHTMHGAPLWARSATVAAGSSLIDGKALKEGDWNGISAKARVFATAVAAASRG